MGLVTRLKRHVSGSARLVRTFVRSMSGPLPEPAVVAPEAEAPAPAPVVVAPEPAPVPLPQPVDIEGRDAEPFWFLKDGQAEEGWDTTNPSEEWRERHGDAAPEHYGVGSERP